LFTLTEGLPLYLREVVRAGLGQGVLALDNGRWRWQGRLAGSDRLVALMSAHMARMGEAERRVTHLVAFGEPVPVEIVRELAPPQALAAAEADGFVAVDESARPPVVRLAHPLYGEVLRDQVPTLTAQEHQRDLAAAAVAHGWHVRDPLQVASWWLASGATAGDPEVLIAAARRAQLLADWDLADRLAQGAAASGAGAQAQLIRAAALVPMGRYDDAEAVLAELTSGDVDDEVIAEAVTIRASLLFWRRGRADDARQAVAEAAVRLSGRAHARVAAFSSYLALFAGDADEAARLATVAVAEAGADTELRVHALASAAMAWAFTGRTSKALAAVEQARPYLAAVLESGPHPMYPAANVLPAQCFALALHGRLDDAAAVADAELARLSDQDAKLHRTVASTLAGWVALRQGRVDRACQLGREVLQLNREADQDPGNAWPAAIFATASAQVGDLSGEAELDAAASASPITPMTAIEVKLARAWLAAAQGELSAAKAIAAEAAADAAACASPAYELFALVDLARLGAPARAAPRLADLVGDIEGDYAPTVAAFVAALAAGDARALDDASTDLERMGAVALAAEAAAAAAREHVHAGRRGSHLASLAHARALATACGNPSTPGLRDLDAAPVLDTLTDREREVVEFAARGLTNREIASRLFVSVRTVHSHLCRAYAKLGVNERHQLAPVVFDRPSGPVDA
jgi:DNA-binding CsgD family transcriptional regulator